MSDGCASWGHTQFPSTRVAHRDAQYPPGTYAYGPIEPTAAQRAAGSNDAAFDADVVPGQSARADHSEDTAGESAAPDQPEAERERSTYEELSARNDVLVDTVLSLREALREMMAEKQESRLQLEEGLRAAESEQLQSLVEGRHLADQRASALHLDRPPSRRMQSPAPPTSVGGHCAHANMQRMAMQTAGPWGLPPSGCDGEDELAGYSGSPSLASPAAMPWPRAGGVHSPMPPGLDFPTHLPPSSMAPGAMPRPMIAASMPAPVGQHMGIPFFAALAHPPKDLSSTVVDTLKRAIVPHSVQPLLVAFRARLMGVYPLAAWITTLTPPQLWHYLEADMHGALQSADVWCATQLLACIERTKGDGADLMSRIFREESPAAISGCYLVFELEQIRTGTTGTSIAQRVDAFSKKAFFAMNMSEAEFVAARESLLQEFAVLPQQGLPLLRVVLNKLPAALPGKAELERQVHYCEVQRRPPPFSVTELFHMVQPTMVKAGATASVSERPPREDKERGERLCNTCGKPGCHHRTCTQKCSTCKLDVCCGAFGKPCRVKGPAAKDPPQDCKNANGRLQPAWAQKKQAKEWARAHPSDSRSKALLAAPTEAPDDASAPAAAGDASCTEAVAQSGGGAVLYGALAGCTEAEPAPAAQGGLVIYGMATSGAAHMHADAADGIGGGQLAIRGPVHVGKSMQRAGLAAQMQICGGQPACMRAALASLAASWRIVCARVSGWLIALKIRRADVCGSELKPEACMLCDLGAGRVWLMPDSGANVSLFGSAELVSASTRQPTALQVAGVWGGSASGISEVGTTLICVSLEGGGEHVIAHSGCIAPTSRRNVWSVSQLYDVHGAVVLHEPERAIVWPDGARTPLHRDNGLYFVDARVLGKPDEVSAAIDTSGELDATMVTARQVGQERFARTWAARLALRGDALTKVLQCCDGMGETTLTPLMRRAADDDTLIRKSWMRRWTAQPCAHSEVPGKIWLLDAAGPFQAKSAVDGSIYELTAVDDCTSFGYVSTSGDVRQATILQFIVAIKLTEKSKYNHVLEVVQVDRVPNLDTQSFEAAAHKEGVLVRWGGRNRHEAVAAVSVRQDIVERRAESMLARSRDGGAFLLPARVMCHLLLNEMPREGRSISRAEHHGAGRFDFSKRPPYAFGTLVAILNEKGERGPKGTVAETESPAGAGRQTEAKLVGWAREGYIVKSLRTGRTMQPADVTPLNEFALVCRGVPDGAVPVEASTQTETTAPAARASRKAVARSAFPDVTPYEMVAPLGERGPPSTRTRSAGVSLVVDLLDLASLLPTAEHTLLLEAAATQWCCEPTSGAQEVQALLARAARGDSHTTSIFDGGQAEVHKAKATHVQVSTALGPQTITVPATEREVRADVRSSAWLDSGRRAAEVVILSGNPLITLREARAKGYEIVGSVMQRKLKLHYPNGTGAMPTLKENGLSSRLCADDTIASAMAKKRGESRPRAPRKAEIADHPTLKMQVAACAWRNRSMASADITTAYPKGERTRPPVVMRLPPSLRDEYASEAEEEQGILLLCPHFGEPPAGDEWYITFSGINEDAGWDPAEGCPALSIAALSLPAQMSLLVDDTLITQDQPPGVLGPDDYTYDAADSIVQVWREKFGDDQVKYEREPRRHAGYGITRRYEIFAINLNMMATVNDLILEYLPQLDRDGLRVSAHLPKGVTLTSLLQALRLPAREHRAKVLSAEQKRYQRVMGALRFPELCDPSLTLKLRFASKVMVSPPDDIMTIVPTERGVYGMQEAMPTCVVIADLLIEVAASRRHIGITYGGAPSPREVSFSFSMPPGWCEVSTAARVLGLDAGAAPMELEASSDATWARVEARDDGEPHVDDVLGVIVTAAGGAVLHMAQGLNVQIDCSSTAEGYAVTKAEQKVLYLRNVGQALGILDDESPTPILTDGDSARQVITGEGAAGRSKHALRRYVMTKKRVRAGLISPTAVTDAANPADFLTKFISAVKLRASLAYATNSLVWHGAIAAAAAVYGVWARA